MTDDLKKSRRAYCGNCRGERNCEIHGQYGKHESDQGMWFDSYWYILRCQGCDHVFAMRVDTNSESIEYEFVEETGQMEPVPEKMMSYWPALAKRPLPDWFAELAGNDDFVRKLEDVLHELNGALNADLFVLAAIGVRTCFDVASEILQVETELSFQKKVRRLIEAGHIRELDGNRILTLIDGGSASAHRGWNPSPDDLSSMVDILEAFVFESLILPKRRARLDTQANQLAAKVPKRKPVAKKPKK